MNRCERGPKYPPPSRLIPTARLLGGKPATGQLNDPRTRVDGRDDLGLSERPATVDVIGMEQRQIQEVLDVLIGG